VRPLVKDCTQRGAVVSRGPFPQSEFSKPGRSRANLPDPVAQATAPRRNPRRRILRRTEAPVWPDANAGARSPSNPETALARAMAEYLSGAPPLPMPMDDVSYCYRMEADKGGSE
jgi:hypothetical protein